MSLASRAADLYYSYRFIKILTRPWEEMDAYKLGIIDENGKRIKNKKVTTKEEKAAFTTFHRLVFNVKRLISRVSGSQLASYASALYLLKEHLSLSDNELESIAEKCGIDLKEFINEKNMWYVTNDKQLSPGIYKLKEEKTDSLRLMLGFRKGEKIRVRDDAYPIDEVFGIDIYEAYHVNTGMLVHITAGEIIK